MKGSPWAAQTPVQVYWKELLKHIQAGELTPEMVRMPCSACAYARAACTE